MTGRSILLAEFLGTAVLLTAVVGSGIMGERLAGGNVAVALLANSLATAMTLFVLIEALGPLSGAHFNPAVSLMAVLCGEMKIRELIPYLAAQISGAFFGVAVANRMFDRDFFAASLQGRRGTGLWLGELVATLGLLATIRLVGRERPRSVPAAVACWIGGAYWFTSSTSFANPAVTLARSTTDTFTGIAAGDVLPFVAVQIGAVVLAAAFVRLGTPTRENGR